MKTIAKIKKNEEKNGVEIYFNVYPLEGTKETLKKNGFRWSRKNGCWYAKRSADAENIAEIVADTTLTEYENIAKKTGEEVKAISDKANRKAATKAPQKNKYGVKVGDVFSMSWGYEQTNNDFFQVVSVTACGCRVREVSLKIKNDAGVSPFASKRTYTTEDAEPVKKSIWIKNQEEGDFKKINQYSDAPSVSIGNYFAYLEKKKEFELYESWGA